MASAFAALDSLLSRPAAPIRLLPLGLTGSRRFISFVHDWDAARHIVARQGGRPMALAAAVEDEHGWLRDVFGLARAAMPTAAGDLADRLASPRAEVASTDADRRGALEDIGFTFDGTHTSNIAGAQMSLCTYVG